MAESKSEGKDSYVDDAKGEAKGGGGGDYVALKVINSDKIVLYEGEVPRTISLEAISGKYLPDPPDGSSWSLFDGSVKVPQTMKIGDMTDADSLTLNASYKAVSQRK